MALRDMSRREFHAALARRGWRISLLWIVGMRDADGHSMGVGLVMSKKRGEWKIDRRASLAKAIRESKRPGRQKGLEA